MPDSRSNDTLILSALKELKEDLKDHREEMQHAIHGNGTPGLKTKVELIQARMMIMWGFLSAALIAIVNDYIKHN